MKLKVNKNNVRIDKYIAENVGELSRSYIQRLIEDGNVLVNNIVVKSSYKVVENDDTKAVYYYDLAANEDYVPAQMILAECYEKGFGTPKDLNKAVYWYQRAAANKNYDAEKKLTKFKKKSDGTWVKKLF